MSRGVYHPIKYSLDGKVYKDQKICPDCGWPVELNNIGFGCINPECIYQFEIIKNIKNPQKKG